MIIITPSYSTPGCTTPNCESEARELRFDDETGRINKGMGIDVLRSIAASTKRDCSSPMCWFRPGKRESHQVRSNDELSNEANVNEGREAKESDQSCRSPMCWFRGKKRSMKRAEMAKRKAALKKLLQKIKALKEKKTRQVSEDGCDSPMCWFRPGRELEDLQHGKTAKYDRELHVIQEAVKREVEKRLRTTDAKKISKRFTDEVENTNEEMKY